MMSKNLTDNDDWNENWKKARRKSVPYFLAAFVLYLFGLLFFIIKFFFYQPVLAPLPWWLSFVFWIAAVPFLIYGFILARRARNLIPEPDSSESKDTQNTI